MLIYVSRSQMSKIEEIQLSGLTSELTLLMPKITFAVYSSNESQLLNWNNNGDGSAESLFLAITSFIKENTGEAKISIH